jgi:tRNA(Arg) A34 adenosine deaminase TadA
MKLAEKEAEAALRMGEVDISTDVEFMKLAEKEAEAALRMGEVPVGCVFVRNGAVVAR